MFALFHQQNIFCYSFCIPRLHAILHAIHHSAFQLTITFLLQVSASFDLHIALCVIVMNFCASWRNRSRKNLHRKHRFFTVGLSVSKQIKHSKPTSPPPKLKYTAINSGQILHKLQVINQTISQLHQVDQFYVQQTLSTYYLPYMLFYITFQIFYSFTLHSIHSTFNDNNNKNILTARQHWKNYSCNQTLSTAIYFSAKTAFCSIQSLATHFLLAINFTKLYIFHCQCHHQLLIDSQSANCMRACMLRVGLLYHTWMNEWMIEWMITCFSSLAGPGGSFRSTLHCSYSVERVRANTAPTPQTQDLSDSCAQRSFQSI
jgi:hypothetical protein